MWIDLKRHIK
jgi:hypothetical protein